MDLTTSSDASVLWSDVLSLLEESDMQPAMLAMLKSCTATSLDGKALTITTRLAFARRKIMQQHELIESYLEQAAFEQVSLIVELDKESNAAKQVNTGATMTEDEVASLSTKLNTPKPEAPIERKEETPQSATHARLRNNPLYEEVPIASSKLTFERFVAGEENLMAFEAAKQVANGGTSYNPLFIHGRSGLGKTHLLRAVQNYITVNDPSRLCVYRSAADFVDEYVSAVRDAASMPKSTLAKNYQDVDVLIIDDVQNMSTAAGTIRFFFETFNYLTSHGKQVLLAADRAPSQLGMGESSFDERDTSRMDSGMTVSIQVPDYELKLNLINTFYDRMRRDAAEEHIAGLGGTISDENLKLMAKLAGSNIRIIEGFVQACLMKASQRERAGGSLTQDDVIHEAAQKWPSGQRSISVEQIQKTVEEFYHINHEELISAKRNKELMEPRHVAIWLTRQLTDNTLADIGSRFGGRSHATVKHSIAWVDDAKAEDRMLYERVEAIYGEITDVIT